MMENIIRVKPKKIVKGIKVKVMLAKIILNSTNKNSPIVNQQDVLNLVNHVAQDIW